MRAPWVLAVVALVLLPLAPTGAEPAPDASWWERTALDKDRDGVEDALDGRAGTLRVLVSFAAPPTPAQLAALAELGAEVVRVFRAVPVVAVEAPADALPRLAGAPGVVLVEQDRPLWPLLDKSRVAVRADRAAKNFSLTGRGVAIAVLDSGVDTTHRDFQGRVVASWDATAPPALRDGLLGQQIPVVPEMTSGHGTHVAGIAAGPGTASGGRYAGVAPGAAVVNIKVFASDGSGSSSYVLDAIDWVVARKASLGIRVLAMSLGGEPTDGTDALSRAIDGVALQGLLTVAAAGNKGPGESTVGVPGVAARALTVGAVDDTLRIAPFSSRGPTPDGRQKPDLVAPGVAIMSTLPATAARGGGYGELSGTSMAAPHVAGAAALLWEANATLSPAEVKYILMATSRAVGPTAQGWDAAYGWGLLDAEAAVRAAKDPGALDLHALREAVPFDGAANPFETIRLQAEQLARGVPGAPVALVAAAVALAAAFARRR